MESMSFFREQSIKSDFKFDKFLGEGSFASVYKAICRRTNREFAIKIFDKYSLEDDDQLALQMECEIMANMDHPNIVKFECVYSEKSRIFVVMELMSGGELLDRIIEKERFSEEEARHVIRPIVDAVHYCHAMGIVHRDLKPENLLFDSNASDAMIKIADFGVAKFIQNEQLMTTACGSPSYIAPEVLKGSGYTFAVDNWSIGIILFVMLFGFPPFYDDTNERLFEKIKKGSFEFPVPIADGVSVEAKELITAILKVDPNERLTAEQILAHPWIQSPKKDGNSCHSSDTSPRYGSSYTSNPSISISKDFITDSTTTITATTTTMITHSNDCLDYENQDNCNPESPKQQASNSFSNYY